MLKSLVFPWFFSYMIAFYCPESPGVIQNFGQQEMSRKLVVQQKLGGIQKQKMSFTIVKSPATQNPDAPSFHICYVYPGSSV